MRNMILSAAVAAVLASPVAGAANIEIYVSGASAQRNFWRDDLQATVCGGGAITTYKITGLSPSTDNPDNQAFRCTAAPPTAITGVSNGDRVTLHYSAELGSIWGLVPFIGGGHRTTRLFLDPDSLDCSGTNCTISSYSASNESFGSTNGTALVAVKPDVGTMDLEAKHWTNTYNWPGYTAVGTAPTLPQAIAYTTADAAISGTATAYVLNGQVFTVIANSSGPLSGLGNISSASMRAIQTGKYNVWGDVPEIAGDATLKATWGATPIHLCRRDQGSGTQVAASVFFTGRECGRSNSAIATTTGSPGPGSLGAAHVIENGSSDKVRACVQGDSGSVGITSYGTSSSYTYTTLRLDGVQANAHNAAAGIYPFAFETFAYDNSVETQGSGSAANNIVAKLIGNARKATSLASIEGGSLLATSGSSGMAGQWFTSSPKVAYALPGGGFGNTKSTTSWATTAQATTALAYRAGDNCKLLVNDNTN